MRQLWAVGWMPNYLRHAAWLKGAEQRLVLRCPSPFAQVVAQMLIEYLDLTWKHGLDAGLQRSATAVPICPLYTSLWKGC